MEALQVAPNTAAAPSLLAEVPGWYADARCIEADPEAFFPDKGGTADPAVAVCRTCRVMDECRDYAVAEGFDLGVWGGTSSKERRHLRSEPQAS